MRKHQTLSIATAALLLLVSSMLTSCSELKTNLPLATSNSLQVHDDNWDNNPASSTFHGTYLKSNGWQTNECKACHGSTFTGGTSGRSCYKCHPSYPHPAGFANGKNYGTSGLTSGTTHGSYMYTMNYPYASCQMCHGSAYSGGAIANVTCMRSGCHADAANTPRSPESCNTCHGVFTASASNSLASAPPRSVMGDSATTARGVGAHQKHLVTNTVGVAVKCQECHTVPSQLSSPGHLGTSLPAEVVFNDQLAHLSTGGGSVIPKPTYDPSSLKCSNTYCHGDWKLRKATSTSQYAYTDSVMVGLNYSPTWTNGSADGACGSCHGLPPKGHIVVPLSTCGSCHFGIVSTDGKIIDKAKHINGKVNVSDQEYSF
jgi:predicted CxxxxCH...CXXCH cytochrome family protein